MKFAAIVPEDGRAVLTAAGHSYHMVLGHEIVESTELREFYRNRSDHGDFIIVDNGVAEGSDVPFIDVVRAANEIGADEIILPDVIGDSEASLSATLNPDNYSLVEPMRRVVVPQAMSPQELVYAMTKLHKIDFATIALNRGPKKECGARLWKLQELSRMNVLHKYHIHLLGVAQNPALDLARLSFAVPFIRSVDSAAPFAYAQAGLDLEDLTAASPHVGIEWDWPWRDEGLKMALSNFFKMRRWCSGADR
jgi:hypothetical protein